MAHGYPDYGTQGPVSTVHSIQDMGELAARLGSIDTFDRRGNVIFMDDFESGLSQWLLGEAGAGELNWNGQYSRNGGFSCQIKTDPTLGFEAWITKYIKFRLISLMGIEFSVSSGGNWQYLTLDLLFQLAAEYVVAAIRYNHSTGKIEYSTGIAAWANIPNIDFAASIIPQNFDTIKLVVDSVNRKFKRLILNSQEFDISTLDCYSVAAGGLPSLASTIILSTDGVGAAIAYIDDVIVTQNEI